MHHNQIFIIFQKHEKYFPFTRLTLAAYIYALYFGIPRRHSNLWIFLHKTLSFTVYLKNLGYIKNIWNIKMIFIMRNDITSKTHWPLQNGVIYEVNEITTVKETFIHLTRKIKYCFSTSSQMRLKLYQKVRRCPDF